MSFKKQTDDKRGDLLKQPEKTKVTFSQPIA